MNQHYLPGNPPLEINLRRSKQAKRMSLRVSRLDGRVTLTIPNTLPESHALDFAREKENWLRAQQGSHGEAEIVGIGSHLPVRGQVRVVEAGRGRRVLLKDDQIMVPGAPETAARRLVGHLKQLARADLAAASDRYARALGKSYSRLTIRDTRSRWGSCSSSGGLMYSWRLILAPPKVLSYVAAHEVAHLAEMNHSANFWQLVEHLYGDYAPQRSWLRDNGHELHRFRFED